jgi:hypothetical protein
MTEQASLREDLGLSSLAASRQNPVRSGPNDEHVDDVPIVRREMFNGESHLLFTGLVYFTIR